MDGALHYGAEVAGHNTGLEAAFLGSGSSGAEVETLREVPNLYFRPGTTMQGGQKGRNGRGKGRGREALKCSQDCKCRQVAKCQNFDHRTTEALQQP